MVKTYKNNRFSLRLTMILIIFLSLFFSISQGLAAIPQEPDVRLSFIYSDNHEQNVFLDGEVGTRVRFNNPVNNAYTFSYWVVNGVARPELSWTV